LDFAICSESLTSWGFLIPCALFLLAIFSLSLLIIDLFVWISKLNERSRTLAQQVALLWDQLEALKSSDRTNR
jgi:hypothetical protein